MKIELSEEEAKLLDTYVFRKARNLEVSNLTDAECYKMFMKIHAQITAEIEKANKQKYPDWSLNDNIGNIWYG